MARRTDTSRPSGTETREDDAFLSRWARRKRIARSGGDPDALEDRARREDASAHAEPAPGDAPPDDAAAEGAELTDEDMPPVESIDENTDMSGFLSPGVSEALKKAALKKFFHSRMFNVVDGLDDYDEDFRTFEALGEIITSDMRGRMEREAERAKEALAKDAHEGEPATAEQAPEAAPAPDVAAGERCEQPGTPRPDGAGAAPAQPARPGITRDPARPARSAPAKLRPAAARSDDSDADDVGDGDSA